VDRKRIALEPHVAAYVATLVAELAERYPGVTGFRLDWPEYPPYDFASALFDFNPAAMAAMRALGAIRRRLHAVFAIGRPACAHR